MRSRTTPPNQQRARRSPPSRARRRNPGDGPEVYIGPVADTTAGAWLSLESYDQLEQDIDELLKSKPQYEEWEIMDTSDAPGLRGGIQSALEWAERYEDAMDRVRDSEEVLAIMEYIADTGASVKHAMDNIVFGASSEEELAGSFVDSLGGLSELGMETLERYFDWDTFARDLAMDYTKYRGYYFRND